MAEKITIATQINAPASKVWEYYTNPEHVMKWNHASDDWHSPSAENDLRVGGQFKYRMEAKEANAEGVLEGFDFTGTYTTVEEHRLIQYTMDDGRMVTTTFSETEPGTTTVEVVFDAETENPIEVQREGWQAILDNLRDAVML